MWGPDLIGILGGGPTSDSFILFRGEQSDVPSTTTPTLSASSPTMPQSPKLKAFYYFLYSLFIVFIFVDVLDKYLSMLVFHFCFQVKIMMRVPLPLATMVSLLSKFPCSSTFSWIPSWVSMSRQSSWSLFPLPDYLTLTLIVGLLCPPAS